MTAKEDKKTLARVGRVPGLILAQRWGRPSLASLSGRINEEPEWCFVVILNLAYPNQRSIVFKWMAFPRAGVDTLKIKGDNFISGFIQRAL